MDFLVVLNCWHVLSEEDTLSSELRRCMYTTAFIVSEIAFPKDHKQYGILLLIPSYYPTIIDLGNPSGDPGQ